MHRVDPKRLDLAREFQRNPVGPHGQELQHLLKLMRWTPATDRYLSVQPAPGGPWYLARTRGPKGVALEVFRTRPYATLAEAHWAVFRKRWEQHTGAELVLADDDRHAASGDSTLSTDMVSRPLLGYADRFSVEAGQAIDFKVSSALTGEYDARIVRVRCADRANLGLKVTEVPGAVAARHPGRAQPIRAGSYVEVPNPGAFVLGTFTLHAYIWPTAPGSGVQCVMGNWNDERGRGYALVIDESGGLVLWLGDGVRRQRLATGAPLRERNWYLVAASIDAGTGRVWVGQRPIFEYARDPTNASDEGALEVGPAPGAAFRIAAWSEGEGGAAGGCFNGKLEAPVVLARGLDAAERRGIMERGVAPESDDGAVARWDFAREIPSTRVVDTSANGRHGQTVNLPTRAMKGVRWDGSEFNWVHRPEHYAAVHFHDDDLYDCAWETDFTYAVPDDLRSGLYCAHLSQDGHEDWIPFVVRPPRGTARSKLALILPSASYWAYANRHTVIDYEGREQMRAAFSSADATGLYLHHHPELGLSMYDNHSDGSGVCYSSRLRPVLSIRPDEALWQLPADTHIIDWLEASGIDFDVLTEDDLDAEGYDLLRPYRCVMTGTHPEYPSARMLDAIAAFQREGGRFIYMGGNGFYWRVSYHPELPGVIEMRRAEDGIRAWLAEGGEYYHSFTGELGGMWRRMGRAPQSVAGAGMTAQGFDRSTWYERTGDSFDPRAAFIFEGIGETERIGDFGIIGGGAAGAEIDRADASLGTPPHALVVARATEFSAAYHWMKEELTHTHSAITGDTCPHVHCDMVFYETPKGGAVFSTSSIAWSGALAHNDYDNNVARIMSNVVRRFLDPAPL